MTPPNAKSQPRRVFVEATLYRCGCMVASAR